jgi:hypothetical protein
MTRQRRRNKTSQGNVTATVECSRSGPHAHRLASRYFQSVQSLAEYVAEINTSLPHGTSQISLVCLEDAEHPAYTRLVSQVLLAWPACSASKRVPDGIVEGLTAPSGVVSHDDLISRVISGVLAKYPHGYEAQAKNVLCNGYALGRPGGKGSVFRNLDARAPSSAVNTLRSPAWKRLFDRFGHVAARHLLDHAVLLMPIKSRASTALTPESSHASPGKLECSSVTLLQLCGPLPEKAYKYSNVQQPESIIHMKQDVLYHGPIRLDQNSSNSRRKREREETATGSPHFELINRGLPVSHPLQTLRGANEGDPETLFGMIFPSYVKFRHQPNESACEYQPRKRFCSSVPGQRRSVNRKVSQASDAVVHIPARMRSILPYLRTLLNRTAKRSFRAVLADMCPISPDENPKRTKRMQAHAELVALTTPPGRVAKFLIRSFRQMLPLGILGSLHNRTLFERVIMTLVRSRTQNESVDIVHIFAERGLKVTDIPWLVNYRHRDRRKVCNPTDLKFRQKRVADLLNWLIRKLCLPLLHQNFYVSERENTRHRVLFYRREVWTALTDATILDMLKSDRRQYTMLSRSAFANVMLQRKNVIAGLGCWFCPFPVLTHSHIRFLPKSSGARGIQRPRVKLLRGFARGRISSSMNSCGALTGNSPASVILEKAQAAMKTFYSNALEILSSECKARPEVLGASVFSNDEIYSKFSRLVENWKEHGRPAMYFVCMDITRSFDTVPLGTLVSSVLPLVLRRDRYVVLRYAVVRRDLSTGTLMCRFHSHVCQGPGEEIHFPRLVREKLGILHLGALFVDLVSVTTIERSGLITALTELVSSNVIAVPRRTRPRSKTAFAIQCQGLPQGSQLSPLLTTLFYGYVERSDLASYLDEGSEHGTADLRNRKCARPQLFMRQVDDSLFATFNKHKAQQLALRMSKGWDDTHGFVINPNKTRANFDANIGGKTDVQDMPWCGFIIDTNTLEVRNDYERYGKFGARIRDTLTIVQGRNAVSAFFQKSRTCFRPKLHAILLDHHINSLPRIALNIYQAALLSALKVCSYSKELFLNRLSDMDSNTPSLLKSMVCSMIDSFCQLVHFGVTNVVALRNGCIFPLQRADVEYLVCHGFRAVIDQRAEASLFQLTNEALNDRVASLRFQDKHGVVRDRNITYQRVTCPSSSPALWKLRL